MFYKIRGHVIHASIFQRPCGNTFRTAKANKDCTVVENSSFPALGIKHDEFELLPKVFL